MHWAACRATRSRWLSGSLCPMPERAWEWTRRIHFGAGRTVPLDFGAELWKRDASLYESTDGIIAALSRTEGPLDHGLILSHATGSLLDDVVDAAGGVESAHARLHQAIVLVQETVTQWSSTLGEISDGTGMSDSSSTMPGTRSRSSWCGLGLSMNACGGQPTTSGGIRIRA